MQTAEPTRLQRLTATFVGALLLVVLVVGTAATFAKANDVWFCTIGGLLFTVPFALSFWHGRLGLDASSPKSARDWLLLFAGSVAMSGAFIAIDLLVVHPGISLIFTFAAVAMAFIALPSAARAWLLELVLVDGTRGGDA